ncbi:MAG: PD-(D/E)XK nuclease family protein, partial [Defluviitaleaceae bacterium]|nr:PD-(D/E)XK nuclease family protein [Defluviitaleaceae bacterium]
QLMIYLASFIEKFAEKKGVGDALKVLPAAAFYFKILNPMLNFDEKLEDATNFKKKFFDEFKMSGLVLSDEGVLKNIGKDHDAKIDFFKSTSVVDGEVFVGLLERARDLAKQAGQDILAGKIDIMPYKLKDKTPCGFCEYHGICKVDKDEVESYRALDEMDAKAIKEMYKPNS